jgi:hypothetical protein
VVREGRGEYDQAERANREALAIYRRHFPDGNPRVATVLDNLGLSLYLKGDHAGGSRSSADRWLAAHATRRSRRGPHDRHARAAAAALEALHTARGRPGDARRCR